MVPENQRDNPWMKKPCRMLSVHYWNKCPVIHHWENTKSICTKGNLVSTLTNLERDYTWLWAAAWIQWILCFYSIWVFHAKTGKLITFL